MGLRKVALFVSLTAVGIPSVFAQDQTINGMNLASGASFSANGGFSGANIAIGDNFAQDFLRLGRYRQHRFDCRCYPRTKHICNASCELRVCFSDRSQARQPLFNLGLCRQGAVRSLPGLNSSTKRRPEELRGLSQRGAWP